MDTVELIDANPTYANIRFPDGRQSTVSLKDVAPCPTDKAENVSDESIVNEDASSGNEEPTSPRRSERERTAPVRYGFSEE